MQGTGKMGFFRTLAMMALGYIAIKTIKRAMNNLETEAAKAKVREPNNPAGVKRLRQDPVTGDYIPEA
jgi:hypothetical protein